LSKKLLALRFIKPPILPRCASQKPKQSDALQKSSN